MQKTLRLTGVGLAALMLGLLIYIVVRPEGSSYLSHFVHFALPVSLENFPLINNLPSFLHGFAFSLLTIVILGERKYALASCLFWLVVNVLFELGQHSYFVQWLDVNKIQVPQVLNTYMHLGTFDVLDVLLSMFGACAAYGFMVLKDNSLERLES